MFRAQSCRPGIRPAGRQADDFPCGSAAFLQQGIKKLSQKRMEELSQKRIEKLLQKRIEKLLQKRMEELLKRNAEMLLYQTMDMPAAYGTKSLILLQKLCRRIEAAAQSGASSAALPSYRRDISQHHNIVAETAADAKQMEELMVAEAFCHLIEQRKLQSVYYTADRVDNSPCPQEARIQNPQERICRASPLQYKSGQGTISGR